jgi:hypothetical protein
LAPRAKFIRFEVDVVAAGVAAAICGAGDAAGASGMAAAAAGASGIAVDAAGASDAAAGVPQDGQTAAPGSSVAPQLVH